MSDHSKQFSCSECITAVGKAEHKEHTEQEEKTTVNTQEQQDNGNTNNE